MSSIAHHSFSCCTESNAFWKSMNIETHKRNDKRSCAILRKLGKNDDLYISKPDKGNGIVILNRSDYVLKMENLLSDRSKFVAVDENYYELTQRLESRLNKTFNIP